MTRDWDREAPDLAAIKAMANAAFAGLPDEFKAPCANLVILVDEFASDEWLDNEQDAWSITGHYSGLPVTERSDPPDGPPDQVWLYRLPILLEWVERGDISLQDLVAHVLVHEIAHHFGYSDEAIAAIDDWTDWG
jgi:predicted Zn-dependent protease with MMP-like domain